MFLHYFFSSFHDMFMKNDHDSYDRYKFQSPSCAFFFIHFILFLVLRPFSSRLYTTFQTTGFRRGRDPSRGLCIVARYILFLFDLNEPQAPHFP